MRRLLVRPAAHDDLLAIWKFIAKDNVQAANRVSLELDRAIRGLQQMPGKGHQRSDVSDKQYRFWSVFSYVIAYRYDDTSLTVVRVIHGRRDFRRLFPEAP